ncbi:MAG: NADH:flavin oxidoreductase/NADH oxidase family protein [Pseudomonadota bacterium]
MPVTINDPLTLPSGLTLQNRLVKAAMTECIAGPDNQAHEGHVRLYGRWADGGLGLQITGNVQVDRMHLEDPANVVIDGPVSNQYMEMLAAWAAAASRNGCLSVVQLSHAGRQTPKVVNSEPFGPSDVVLNMPGGQFAQPTPMSEDDISALLSKFAHAARVCRDAGFNGVQIHAAHGYLISQFLSPIANRRRDQWGGSLENRARLLIESIRAVKATTGDGFSVSAKLNSSDFQKGGYTFAECLSVIDMLNAEGLDFLELSGGNYEQPKMAGIEGFQPAEAEDVAESTRAREAYFADYTKQVKKRSKMPIMVTGGFRSRVAMDAVLSDGEADLIGLARPLCADPDAPQKLISGEIDSTTDWENQLSLGPTRFLGRNSPFGLIKAINGFGMMGWFAAQIEHLARGEAPNTELGVFSAFVGSQNRRKEAAKAYKAALDETKVG